MTADDLRAWQATMGYTYDTAAAALGVNRSTYAGWISGIARATGKPANIDRRTALACAALAAGLGEWSSSDDAKK
jgi:hypothetical protein